MNSPILSKCRANEAHSTVPDILWEIRGAGNNGKMTGFESFKLMEMNSNWKFQALIIGRGWDIASTKRGNPHILSHQKQLFIPGKFHGAEHFHWKHITHNIIISACSCKLSAPGARPKTTQLMFLSSMSPCRWLQRPCVKFKHAT